MVDIWKLRLVDSSRTALEKECEAIVMDPTAVFLKLFGELALVFSFEF